MKILSSKLVLEAGKMAGSCGVIPVYSGQNQKCSKEGTVLNQQLSHGQLKLKLLVLIERCQNTCIGCRAVSVHKVQHGKKVAWSDESDCL